MIATHHYFALKSLEPLKFCCKSTANLSFGRFTAKKRHHMWKSTGRLKCRWAHIIKHPLPLYPDQTMFPTSIVSGHVFWIFTKEFLSGNSVLTTFVCYVPRQTGYTLIRLSGYVNVVSHNTLSNVVMSQHFLSIKLSVGRKSLAFTLS
jgi:hypothetical protein